MTISINDFPKQKGDPDILPSKLFTASGSGEGDRPGLGKRMRQITFTLKTEDGEEVNIEDSTIHCQHWKDKEGIERLNWVIVFEKVDPSNGKDYTLKVMNADYKDDDAEKSLKVKALSSSTERIVISNPLNNATFSRNGFAPYGTTDTLLPLFAVLSVPGASSVNGTPVQGPPGTTNWVFSFTQLPTGSNATLTVFSSSQSSTATGLTITS